jgi:GAF domain-containing protein
MVDQMDTVTANLDLEHAALRRVAILVANGAPPQEVFSAVTLEAGQLLSAQIAGLARYGDETVTVIAVWYADAQYRSRTAMVWPLGGGDLASTVHETGRPVRIETYEGVPGPIAAFVRDEMGIGSSLASPIIVEGRLWGVLFLHAKQAHSPFTPDAESRLTDFAELLATAVANTESRAELSLLAEEQAALHRVAALVAHGSPSGELFTAVTKEVRELFRSQYVHLGRFEPDNTVTYIAASGGPGPLWVGTHFKLGGNNVTTTIARTGRPARIEGSADATGPIATAARDNGVRSTVGTPVMVDGRLWGAMIAGSDSGVAPPPDTEARLQKFTELLGTAISNADSRAEIADLVEEKEALRRIATLVASRTSPTSVFSAVVEQVGGLFPIDTAALSRYESDETLTFVAIWGKGNDLLPAGSRWKMGGRDIGTLVYTTGRPARIEDYDRPSGQLSEAAGQRGYRSSVGAPIIVEGRLWGMMGVSSCEETPIPRDTESRLESFANLVAMAISNAESREELKASRARIVAAADSTRRRIERDLHDGTQQQLISLMLELRSARASLPPGLADLDAQQARIEQGLDAVLNDLREMSRGIHPTILTKAGLGPALKTLARRSVLPVELELLTERRLPEHIEVATYYVASEAITNATKHARASVVNIQLSEQEEILTLVIRDDGVGGADPGQGTGLVGLFDRIEAMGGRLELTSPLGVGTSLTVEIPIEEENAGF